MTGQVEQISKLSGKTNTRILTAVDPVRDREAVKEAAHGIREGRLVVIPTETVYGLGANALLPQAVAGIFTAKGRPQDNPLIVHITSMEEMEPLVDEVSDAALALARAYWPGPLTMILPKSGLVQAVVSGGLDTVAVRMPSHPIARAIIRQSGVPVAAPSANLSGTPSPTRAEHCTGPLNGRVDIIVDGGECQVGLESTVVTLAGKVPRLLRPGAITLEQLQAVLGEVEVDPAVTQRLTEEEPVSSPGMKYRHYAPKTKLTLVHGPIEAFCAKMVEEGAAAMVFDEDIEQISGPCIAYGGVDQPLEQAKRLFAALRELDNFGISQALVRAPKADGVGLAVYNRLLRAAGFSETYL